MDRRSDVHNLSSCGRHKQYKFLINSSKLTKHNPSSWLYFENIYSSFIEPNLNGHLSPRWAHTKKLWIHTQMSNTFISSFNLFMSSPKTKACMWVKNLDTKVSGKFDATNFGCVINMRTPLEKPFSLNILEPLAREWKMYNVCNVGTHDRVNEHVQSKL